MDVFHHPLIGVVQHADDLPYPQQDEIVGSYYGVASSDCVAPIPPQAEETPDIKKTAKKAVFFD